MKKYEFNDLVMIMERLRGEGGCPWDREQTHQSLKRYLIEEAYEVLEAIDSGSGAKMADELGDLLLQIVFHAQIGAENGEFTIDDVIEGICEKMLRRHPHIFGDVKAETAGDVVRNWDAIKADEKGLKSRTEELKSISTYLPALMRAQKVQHKAAKGGLDWDDIEGVFDKLREEIGELKKAVKEGERAEEELGDLLFTVVNISRFLKAEPEQALTNAIGKFIRRFEYVENNAGKDMAELSPRELDKLWEQAKESGL